jgi:hypothetical protein
MILRSSTFLGISLGDRSIAFAEVAVNGGKRVVRRTATMPLTPDRSLDKPAALGPAVAAFLRERKFTAPRAVVGIPAKWLIALEKEIPPAADEQARAMLRLQAERLAVSETGDMIFDFVGQTDANRATKVLLVGVPKQRVDQVEAVLQAAGIDLQALTSSALTLAAGASGGPSAAPATAAANTPMLFLGRQGAEMVWRSEGTPRMLRHVAVIAVNGHGPVTLGPLGSELGRALALTRGNGSTGAGGARELLLWDGVGLSDEQLAELSEKSGATMRPSDPLGMLGLEPAPGGGAATATLSDDEDHATPDTFAPALSLALAAADRALLPVDFTRSKLTPRRARRVGERTTWAIAAGVFIALALGALYFSVESKQRELDAITRDLDAKKVPLAAAQATFDHVRYATGYLDARPPLLDCLLEISKTYRDEDRIWTTSLSLREEEKRNPADKSPPGPAVRRGQLQGKAADPQTVNNVIDRLSRNRKFTDVKVQDVRDAGGKTREYTFVANFNFIVQE